MSPTSPAPKFILVLGTTYSGSGAVWDYLAGRPDLRNPLRGEEYMLPQAPHGLMSLESVAGCSFHPALADYSIQMFRKTALKLLSTPSFLNYGKNYSYYLPDFPIIINDFIASITTPPMSMHLDWHKLFMSRQDYLIYKLRMLFRLPSSPPLTRLLLDPHHIITAAQQMHNTLFSLSDDNTPVLLNQAGSGWNPIESTKYFSSRKIVLVTRSPLDQYADLKKYKKLSSPIPFAQWYIQLEHRLAGLSNENLHIINFEDFVCNHTATLASLTSFLDLDPSLPSVYNPTLSLPNVGHYVSALSRHEISTLTRLLNL